MITFYDSLTTINSKSYNIGIWTSICKDFISYSISNIYNLLLELINKF